MRQKIYVCFTVRHEPKKVENHWLRVMIIMLYTKCVIADDLM
jgi:hypothetical protein